MSGNGLVISLSRRNENDNLSRIGYSRLLGYRICRRKKEAAHISCTFCHSQDAHRLARYELAQFYPTRGRTWSIRIVLICIDQISTPSGSRSVFASLI